GATGRPRSCPSAIRYPSPHTSTSRLRSIEPSARRPPDSSRRHGHSHAGLSCQRLGGAGMTALIEWNQLPRWVPGRILLQSDELGWKNVGLRSYHYQGQDVIVPAMRDYMLVSDRQGVTPMQRRFDGKWRKETLSPGAVSFLTRAQRAFWNWRNPVEVTHVYLSGALVTEVASEVFDCQVPDVRLAD